MSPSPNFFKSFLNKLTSTLVIFLVFTQIFNSSINFSSFENKSNNLLLDFKNKVVSAFQNSLIPKSTIQVHADVLSSSSVVSCIVGSSSISSIVNSISTNAISSSLKSSSLNISSSVSSSNPQSSSSVIQSTSTNSSSQYFSSPISVVSSSKPSSSSNSSSSSSLINSNSSSKSSSTSQISSSSLSSISTLASSSDSKSSSVLSNSSQTVSSSSCSKQLPAPELDLTKDFYNVSDQDIINDNFSVDIPISDNFYQAKATLVGSNFSNQIQSEILGKFKSWESGCNFSLNQVNTWYHWSGCWGDQWVGTANGSRAVWNLIWGILKGEFNQIASIVNVDWGALVQNLSNVLSSIKGLVQQIVDLIKNPTILLDLAVAKLDDFNNTEFYQKFFKLGVFISQFTSGVVIFSLAEKTVGTIKNIFTTGKLVEKVGVINSQTNNINIAERIFTDAEKYKTLDNQGRAWMPLQDGLWVPQKKVGNKFMVNGADVNWHLQNGNFNQSNFEKLVSNIDNSLSERKVINNKITKECGCCILSELDVINKFFGAIRVSAFGACGSNNPNTYNAAKYGRQVHAEYAKNGTYGQGFKAEESIAKGMRVDAINYSKKEIIELKPVTPNAVKKGEKQVQNYVDEMKRQTGDNSWTGKVITYVK